MATSKRKSPPIKSFQGQLMLLIASGKLFRPGIPLNEHTHRRTLYTNAWFVDQQPVDIGVASITGSTDNAEVCTALLEVVERLEAEDWNGTQELLIATGGSDLVDDVAYVMTFVLNVTFSRDHDQVRRLVVPSGRRGASRLFPRLFDPHQAIQTADIISLRSFLDDLIGLGYEDFARVMRVIRAAVDASRRAIDDPTGAYTDIVAALESISDDHLSMPATWDRYDGAKRKILDRALSEAPEDVAEKVRIAILEADRVGLKRRFISSTLARIAPSYYRAEAIGIVRPPRSADLERMLSVGYDIRSKRSHVLEDLTEEAWAFADGAETTFDPRFGQILTLAGLWRLVRHATRVYVSTAAKVTPKPLDYRAALPGLIQAQLAPQYWIWQPQALTPETATDVLRGVVDAYIAFRSGHSEGIPSLAEVIERIEMLVPQLADGAARTAMVAIYFLWNSWTDPDDHRPEAIRFMEAHARCLDAPSPIGYAVRLLSNDSLTAWTVDEWALLAATHWRNRTKGGRSTLPPAIDALIQLEAADHLEAAGRHDEAIECGRRAIEEFPGHEGLIRWEEKLLAGDHDPDFDVSLYLFGERAPVAEHPAGVDSGTAGELVTSEPGPYGRRQRSLRNLVRRVGNVLHRQ